MPIKKINNWSHVKSETLGNQFWGLFLTYQYLTLT